MKKTSIQSKLNFHRETLVNLQPDELAGIQGGTNGGVIRATVAVTKTARRVSVVVCTTATAAASHPAITCKDK